MTFEDFLQDWFLQLYPEVYKDQLEDKFDAWLSNLDGEEYIKLAKIFGKQRYLDGKAEILNNLKGTL